MTNQNLAIWNQVEKTDPKYTKPAQLNGMQVTSIQPNSQKKKATEVFGPYGKGWGVVTGSESFKTINAGDTVIMHYNSVFFYITDGETHTFDISAMEKFSYVVKGKNYTKIDTDVDKKLRTNAITKGLSELGFNADIFLGQWDDINYKQLRELEQGIEDAENRQAYINTKTIEFNNWFDDQINSLETINNIDTLQKACNSTWNLAAAKMNALQITDQSPYSQRIQTLIDYKAQQGN